MYALPYGQFSGIYTFLENGAFYGVHFVSNGTVVAGHPRGKLSGKNAYDNREAIAWANFIDDADQVGAQEPAGTFGRTFTAAGAVKAGIQGSMGSFTADASAPKAWASDPAISVYNNPIPLASFTGTYEGQVRTAGIGAKQEFPTGFVISADGKFSITASGCAFSGQLAQHGATGVFDATAQTTGAACKLKPTLKGILTPYSFSFDTPRVLLQLDSDDNLQSVVFSLQRTALATNPPTPPATPSSLTSTSFARHATLPAKTTCSGSNTSPQLQWSISSDAVKGFALIMEDPDAVPIVGYPYVHWAVYNIPGSFRELAEGASQRTMPAGSTEGANDDGLTKYSGPCPPVGNGVHHYVFTLYALNTDRLNVDASRAIKRADFEQKYSASIVQKIELQGGFSR